MNEFRSKTAKTVEISVYIAGNIETIRPALAKFCFENKICFFITEGFFSYVGGEETGFRIGIIKYPRFPQSREELVAISRELALYLIKETHQMSATVVDGEETYWLTRNPKH